MVSIVVLAAAVRLAYFLSKWNTALMLNDSIYYSGQAYQISQGVWFRELFVDQPGAEHGPLTSLLMAPVSGLDNFVRWQRLVTVVAGIVLVWVVGRLATELGGRRVGYVAAALAAVYPNLWMNDGLVMSESIACLFVGLALWAGWRASMSARPGLLLWFGAALGLATLSRSESALLAPLLMLWLVTVWRRSGRTWRECRPIVWSMAAGVAVLLPWVTFNMVRFENPVLLTTNDGTTWLGANCDQSYHGPAAGGWSLDCVLNDPDYSQDEEPSVRSARQRSMAVEYVGDHLGDVPRVVAQRLARTFDLYGWSNLVAQDVGEERPRWASWAGIATFWLLAPLAAVGVWRTSRRVRWLLLAPMVVTLVTTVLFYGAHRFRSTAEMSIVIGAAIALVGWQERRTAQVRRSPSA